MASGAKDIITPHDHDVLSGRGNFVNYHAGNEHFRALVRKHKLDYVKCPKPQKGKFSRIIVEEIKARNPPGRFLKQDATTKLWYDIGEKKAMDKTRQALREGAPDLMKELSGDTDDDASDAEGDNGRRQDHTSASFNNAMGGAGAAMGAGFQTDQLPNQFMASFQSPVMSRNSLQMNMMSPQMMASPQMMSPTLMLSASLSPDMQQQQLSSRQTPQQIRMNSLGSFSQVIPPPQVHSQDSMSLQQQQMLQQQHQMQQLQRQQMQQQHQMQQQQMMINAGMGNNNNTDFHVALKQDAGQPVVANQAELEELQMLQNKLQAIYSNEQFEPRAIPGAEPSSSPSPPANNKVTTKQSKPQAEPEPSTSSSRVEMPAVQNPRRMPPSSLLKRDDSLKSDEVFSLALSPDNKGKKKFDGGSSAGHLSAMSLSIGDMNVDGNLSSVFDTSLKISNPKEKKGSGTGKDSKDRSSSNWEGERFDMSVATIGGASRLSEDAGNMSYATFSEQGQMSFSKVFEDPDKLEDVGERQS